MDSPEADDGEGEGLALTFTLDGETFGVEVGRVAEIIDPPPVTRAPNADPFAPGLVNVRGVIAPLIDLRRRLGMGSGEIGPTSRLLVLDLAIGGEPVKVAMVADAVHSIVETPAAAIEPLPELGAPWPADCVRGVLRREGGLVILLNSETAFPPRPEAAAKAAREDLTRQCA